VLFYALILNKWRLQAVEPIGRANINKELLLNSQQMKQLLDFVVRKRINAGNERINYACAHYLAQYEETIRQQPFYCTAGKQTASITCTGRIVSCLNVQRNDITIQGNLLYDSFIEVWKNKFKIFREDRTNLCSQCISCGHKTLCKGDSAHTWDFNNNTPLHCVMTFMPDINNATVANKKINIDDIIVLYGNDFSDVLKKNIDLSMLKLRDE